ncbi:hypothetical protein JMJ35_007445 [Cladonia borealis]|uniref:Uncharacterized protein n=1 Tax=Cladonia borealis TaxID=184061 RepID=A0AA39QYB1_9LECA|nr:hypothetical protein JMJ35_007445 [Cladonia borealis]
MPPFVNHLLLNKPDRNWDKTLSITSPSPSFSTPFILPEIDEAFLLKSARGESNWAAHNINVCGGNAEGLRALIDNKSYWQTEALHYTALLHKHLHQVTDVVAYWQQEAARQKEALALRLALTKHHADDHPGDMGTPVQHDEDADDIPEKRETLYYTEILHKHLDQAVDAASYWKKEASYQRETLTQWVPSFKDGGDSLRYGIDQLEYWREESRYLSGISQKMVEYHTREYELMKSND